MQLTIETINILFFLIPGFISSFILDSIIVRKESHFLNKLIESLVFTFLIYFITSFYVDIELFASITFTNGKPDFSFSNNITFLITVFISSVLIPIIIGTIIFHDYHMIVLRFFHITDKTSRETTWQDVFIDEKRFIVVHFKDERRIFGWPMYYSNIPENGILYLYDPAWIDDENNYIECDTHGMLIKSEDIQFIEFLKSVKEKGKKNEQKNSNSKN